METQLEKTSAAEPGTRTTRLPRRNLSKRRVTVIVGAIIVLAAAALVLLRPSTSDTGMSTSATTSTESNEQPLDSLEQVMLSNTSVVRSGVKLADVELKNFSTEISAVGVIEVPEPGERTIAAWARGRIEHMYVAASGEYVRKGEPLYDFYSPDILNAEREYLIAKQGSTMTGAETNAMPGMMGTNQGLLRAAKERLALYGLTNTQMDEFNRTGQPINTVTIAAPAGGVILQKMAQEGAYVNEGASIFQLADLSSVWAELEVPESEIRFIRVGQIIPITTDMYPNDKFAGRVILVSPVADQASRTVRVRLDVPNPSGKLRPGMTFVSQIAVPMGNALAVPQDAVIQTGKGDFVWVSNGGNTFTAKQVQLGALSPDDYFQILSGLNAGDQVAAQGAFLVDAEYQLSKSNPMAGMNMGETGTKQSGQGTATVVSIDQAKQTITLNHGNMPGMMPAMTMGYKVSNPQFLTSVAVGESVTFTLTRQPDGAFEITAIEHQ